MAKIGEKGFLVDASGDRIKDAEGNEICIQDEVDRVIDARFRKEKETQERLEETINELKVDLANAVKPEEKAALETRIKDLQTASKTREENLAQTMQEKIAKAEEELNRYRSLYEKESLASQVAAVATEHKFIKPDYLAMQVKDKGIEWVDVERDGKPTGDKELKVRFATKDESGGTKSELVDLSEAAKRIAECEPHLIAAQTNSGPGTSYQPGKSGSDQPGESALGGIYDKK